MEELVKLLKSVNDSSVKDNALEVFKNVATELMSKYAIKKGNDYYQMVEIEFYWYSPNHPDLSVYPRKSNAGNWYLHPSGVDITLESCVNEDISMLLLRKEWENAKKKQKDHKNQKNQENQNVVYSESSYGGILIRTLRKLTTENDPEDSKSFIVGPWNCSDALFDYLPCDGNTINISNMLPVIVAKTPDKIMPMLKGGFPNDFVCKARRSGIEEKHTKEFFQEPYCFYVNEKYMGGWNKGKFPNKPWNSRKVILNENSK